MKNALACLFAMMLLVVSAKADGVFLSSETISITNAASAVVAITNYPSAGTSMNMPWNAGSIILHANDSATGVVLKVEHIRTAVTHALTSTNTFSLTNELHSVTSATAVTTVLWTGAAYPIDPAKGDQLQISTSSTNAVLILNRNIER